MWYGLKTSLEVYIHLGRTFAGCASATLPKRHDVSPMTEDSPHWAHFSLTDLYHLAQQASSYSPRTTPPLHTPVTRSPSFPLFPSPTLFIALSLLYGTFCESSGSSSSLPCVVPFELRPRLVRSSLPPALLFHLRLPMKWCISTDHPKLSVNSSHVCLPEITVFLSGMSLSLSIL